MDCCFQIESLIKSSMPFTLGDKIIVMHCTGGYKTINRFYGPNTWVTSSDDCGRNQLWLGGEGVEKIGCMQFL